jgi:formylglycine-generating enzyme required for sulfatase activity/serine/threonine protein kinase
VFSIGTIIDNRYRIDSKLGEGGMGVVYRAYDIELEKTIALKTLLPQFKDDPESQRDLKREVAVSQGLAHRNIVQVFHLETRSEIPYLIMEFVDGVTLDFYKSRKGRLSLDETLSLVKPILSAIAYAHERGLVHRDIKPQNIMISREGEVKVMDFGIAQVIKDTYTKLTGRPVSGTLYYMAPEHIRGKPPDKRSDIYSLGCLFYELLKGKPPFWTGDVVYQQINEQPAPLEGVPHRISGVILRCLAKDPSGRFQSVEEISMALFGEGAVKEQTTSRSSRLSERAPGSKIPAPQPAVEKATPRPATERPSTQPAAERSTANAFAEGLDAFNISTGWKVFWSLAALLVILLTVTLVMMSGGGARVTSDDKVEVSPGGDGEGKAYAEAESIAYEHALRENSISSWRIFLSAYPDSRHISEARSRLEALEDQIEAEERDFQSARQADTVKAWQAFIDAHPKSWRVNEAGNRVRILEAEEQERNAFEKAQKSDTMESWKDFLAAYPNSERSEQAQARMEELRRTSPLPQEWTNSIGMKFRLIPAGEFRMGVVPGDGSADDDESPRHRVVITKPFYMGVYEVTQEQYRAVMGTNPSYFKGDNHPVEQVSWNDAVEFCRKLSQMDGESYRLPTEAEWEYACRAGSTSVYYWGNSMEDGHAWHEGNSGGQTHPVGQKLPNAWGLYDMSGNVWEWCADWYDSGYYGRSPMQDPQGPSSGSMRVLRGGSWVNLARNLRSSYRNRLNPDFRYGSNGFRILRDVMKVTKAMEPDLGGAYVFGFNEGSGEQFNDGNSSSLVGTLQKGASWVSSPVRDNGGRAGSALLFDGVRGYTRLNEHPVTDFPFTIMFWAKRQGRGGGSTWIQLLRANAPGTKGGYCLWWFNKGEITAAINSSSRNVWLTYPDDSFGEWRHITLVCSGNKSMLYINSRLVASETQSGRLNQPNWPCSIGGQGGGIDAGYFNGIIDGLKIFHRALSEKDIVSIYKYEAPSQ